MCCLKTGHLQPQFLKEEKIVPPKTEGFSDRFGLVMRGNDNVDFQEMGFNINAKLQ